MKVSRSSIDKDSATPLMFEKGVRTRRNVRALSIVDGVHEDDQELAYLSGRSGSGELGVLVLGS